MIRFACSNCRRLISVAEKYSGKKGKCPKCGSVVVVPEKSTIIEFPCGSCGHQISVPERQGGKKGKCPKCQSPVVVPSVKKVPTEETETATVTCSMCGQIAEVPKGSSGELIECPACGLYIESSSERVPAASPESDTSIPRTLEEDIDRESPEEYDETEGVDRRLIILISAVAAIAVVGLVLLVVALRPSRPQQQASELPAHAEDMHKYLSDTLDLVREGKHKEALDRWLWLHDHALEHAPAMYGVRLSYALSYWKELEDLYPPALIALKKTRDDKTALLAQGNGNRYLFHDVMALNRTLGDDSKTVELFRKLDHDQKRMAKQCWPFAKKVIIEAKAYDLAKKYTGIPVLKFGKANFAFLFPLALALVLVLVLVQVISMWIVYEKAGEHGWAILVPFYGAWVLAEIGGKPGWMGLLMSLLLFLPVPFVGLIIAFVLEVIIKIGVARTFGRGVIFGLGLVFVGSICYPILAFSKD